MGVVLVDIGGGTSDIAIFKEGAIVHTGVLAIGGNHITNDIAVGLRTPQAEAEMIKIKHGCSMASMVQADETIEVPGVGGRKPRILSRKLLAEIIEPRVEEIFSLIHQEVMKSGYKDALTGGVVITGGATLARRNARARRVHLRNAGEARLSAEHRRPSRRRELVRSSRPASAF